MSERQARAEYRGYADEPVSWSALLAIYDAIFGEDAREQRSYPESLHNITVSWQDAGEVENRVGPLHDLQAAYESEQTARVTFSGFEAGKNCTFIYCPGSKPPTALVQLQARPDQLEPMLNAVRAAFPHERRVVFVSWSGSQGRAIAEALRDLLRTRLPPGAVPFVSTGIPPGADPYRTMLDENLLPADVALIIMNNDALESHWVTWEAAAGWARGSLVIPIFVDVRPGELKSPLAILRQGGRLNDRAWLDRAIVSVTDRLAHSPPMPLTDEEFTALIATASP
jgi:hypothetical protein